MSIKVMTAVWEHAEAEGATLLVLLALADHANDAGVCWPGIKGLARKSRVSERQVQRILKDLQVAEMLAIEDNAGPKGVNVYTLKLGGDMMTPRHGCHPDVGVGGDMGVTGDKSVGGGDIAVSPEPSLEPSLGSTTPSVDDVKTLDRNPSSRNVVQRRESVAREAMAEKPNVFELYEQTFGQLVPNAILSQRLEDAEQEQGYECVRHCLEETALADVNDWRYTDAILRRHVKEGCYVQADGRLHVKRGPPATEWDAGRGDRYLAGKAQALADRTSEEVAADEAKAAEISEMADRLQGEGAAEREAAEAAQA